jgi:hypothetical protein
VVNRLTGGVDEFFAGSDSTGTTFPVADALSIAVSLMGLTMFAKLNLFMNRTAAKILAV